jgi:hypothetical protein
MSALIAVGSENSIHVLTDAAEVLGTDGTVVRFIVKQFCVSQCVIGTTGYMPVCAQFASLAKDRCRTYDDVVATADHHWRRSQQVVLGGDSIAIDYSVVIAGWSERHQRLELRSIDSRENHITGDLATFATGPTDECLNLTGPFVARFAKVPDAFEPQHGIDLMEALRRRPRKFEQATCSCVGGSIMHSTLDRSGIKARTIHRWPDRVGEHIQLEAA